MRPCLPGQRVQPAQPTGLGQRHRHAAARCLGGAAQLLAFVLLEQPQHGLGLGPAAKVEQAGHQAGVGHAALGQKSLARLPAQAVEFNPQALRRIDRQLAVQDGAARLATRQRQALQCGPRLPLTLGAADDAGQKAGAAQRGHRAGTVTGRFEPLRLAAEPALPGLGKAHRLLAHRLRHLRRAVAGANASARPRRSVTARFAQQPHRQRHRTASQIVPLLLGGLGAQARLGSVLLSKVLAPDLAVEHGQVAHHLVVQQVVDRTHGGGLLGLLCGGLLEQCLGLGSLAK